MEHVSVNVTGWNDDDSKPKTGNIGNVLIKDKTNARVSVIKVTAEKSKDGSAIGANLGLKVTEGPKGTVGRVGFVRFWAKGKMLPAFRGIFEGCLGLPDPQGTVDSEYIAQALGGDFCVEFSSRSRVWRVEDGGDGVARDEQGLNWISEPSEAALTRVRNKASDGSGTEQVV